MHGGGGGSVWHEPALPRVLNTRGGACPAGPMLSRELLSFLSLSPLGPETETQDSRAFLVWGVWAFQKTICRFFYLLTVLYEAGSFLYGLLCSPNNNAKSSGYLFPAAERPLGIDKAPEFAVTDKGS